MLKTFHIQLNAVFSIGARSDSFGMPGRNSRLRRKPKSEVNLSLGLRAFTGLFDLARSLGEPLCCRGTRNSSLNGNCKILSLKGFNNSQLIRCGFWNHLTSLRDSLSNSLYFRAS